MNLLDVLIFFCGFPLIWAGLVSLFKLAAKNQRSIKEWAKYSFVPALILWLVACLVNYALNWVKICC